MSSTSAPEWSTMYWTSSAFRRKLIGTPTRPKALVPNRNTSIRAALWLTIATRAPMSRPMASRPAAIALDSSAVRAYVRSGSGVATWSGSSTMAIRSP